MEENTNNINSLNNRYNECINNNSNINIIDTPKFKKNYSMENISVKKDISIPLINTQVNASEIIKSKTEKTLLSQNQNLLMQIDILKKKLNYFENDNNIKINLLNQQIKNISLNDNKLNQTIADQQKLIDIYKKENKYLKDQINDMENNVLQFKDEVKLLYQSHMSSQNNSEINNEKIKEYMELLKKYSEEIQKLKKENANLINEKIETCNQITSYSNIPTQLNTNNLLNNNIMSNINSINNTCPNNNNFPTMTNVPNAITDISNYINNEISLIVQWIDTYMGEDYDKNFEVPSIINDEITNDTSMNNNINIEINNSNINNNDFKEMNNSNVNKYISQNINLLKNALENSRQKINKIMIKQENDLIEKSNLLCVSENKKTQMQKEINEYKKKMLFNNQTEYKYNTLLTQNEKDMNTKNEKITKYENLLENSKKEFNDYLENLYNMINKEVQNILQESNLKSYASVLTGKNLDEDNDINNINKNNITFVNIKYKLLNTIENFIEFVQQITYDYIKIKADNLKYIKSSLIGNKYNNGNNNESYQSQLEIKNLQDNISKLKSENEILTNEINFLNKNKAIKENNAFNNSDNLNSLNLQIINYENQFDQLKNDYNLLQYEYTLISNNNQQLQITIDDYKKKLANYSILEEQNDKLKKDYQRILYENQMIKDVYKNKNAINNKNDSNININNNNST